MKKILEYIAVFAACLLLYSCANRMRPTGGPQDMLPPIFVKSTPKSNSTNFDGNKVEIEFDELIQLKEQNEKVVISPAQKTPALIRSNGKKVTVEFKDTMIPNTTYSINFSNAIRDFNEENPLEDFSFAFSTGESVDSLQISGMLLNARDLEPMQNVIVGVHSNLNDTAFSKIPLERIARTNDKGEFTIRNLKEGKYRLFALNDVDRDFKFTVTEDIAFCDSVIKPKAERIIISDTLRTVTHEVDTVMETSVTAFTPNDVLLTMFNEEIKPQYLVKDERPDSAKLYLQFATKADSLPEITLPDYKELKDWCKINYSETNDTITYWLTSRELIQADTIRAELKYLKTDTTGNLAPQCDTILFKKKIMRHKKEKKKKHDNDTVKEVVYTQFTVASSTSQDIHLPMRFKALVPLDSVRKEGIHFEQKVDTLWKTITAPELKLARPNDLGMYVMEYKWEPGAEYKLTIDSAAITDIKGCPNKLIEHNFKVKLPEDYCDIYFNVNVRDSAFVELLDSSDKVVNKAVVENGAAEFKYLNPGAYFARIVLDRNNNGRFDTGNYNAKLQPEEVYYFGKRLNIKKNWEIAENWDIYATPVNLQKPEEIKQNKPEIKKWQRDKNKEKKRKNRNGYDDDEDGYYEEENPFGANQYDTRNRNPFDPNSRNRNRNRYNY